MSEYGYSYDNLLPRGGGNPMPLGIMVDTVAHFIEPNNRERLATPLAKASVQVACGDLKATEGYDDNQLMGLVRYACDYAEQLKIASNELTPEQFNA